MTVPPPLTQGRLLDVDEGIGALMRAFVRAEVELRRDLERIVRQEIEGSRTARYRAAQRRALLTRLAEIQASLRGDALVFAEESVARIYGEGMIRADSILSGAGANIGARSFTQVHRAAVEILALDTFDDLARSIEYLEPQTARIIREATKARTTVGALTGASVDTDRRALTRELTRRGVTGFVDAAGRNWRISTYAEMVVRTKSANAYNIGTTLRAHETGTDAFRIADGERSRHDECLRYSGTTCDARWSIANPVEHPNCVRSFGPLPLHRGPVDHSLGGDPVESILSERDRRDLGDLVIVPPDL